MRGMTYQRRLLCRINVYDFRDLETLEQSLNIYPSSISCWINQLRIDSFGAALRQNTTVRKGRVFL